VIRHEFTHKSTFALDQFDSSHHVTSIAIDNASHFDEVLKAKDALENRYNNASRTAKAQPTLLKDIRGKRICVSAENSPILSRSMIGRQNQNQTQGFQRTNSITPRLVLQNIDKVIILYRHDFPKR